MTRMTPTKKINSMLCSIYLFKAKRFRKAKNKRIDKDISGTKT